jgi:O-antigen/teichoic acid export membrane protein
VSSLGDDVLGDDALIPAPGDDAAPARSAGTLVMRGGALRVGSYIASTALSIISSAVLIRHLGVTEYGQYFTAFSLVTIVGAITDAGMTMLGVREYAIRGGEERAAMLRALLGLRLALTFAGVIFAVVFAVLASYDGDLLLGTALAGLGLLGTVLSATYTIPLAADLLIGRLAALDFARQVSTVVLIVVGVAVGAGVVPLLAIPLPVSIGVLVATIAVVRGRMPLRPSAELSGWGALLRITAPFVFAVSVGTLYLYIASVVVPLVTSDAQTGYFGASFRVFIVMTAVPGTLISTAMPLLARAAQDDRERLAYALQRLFEVAVLLGIAFVLATTLGSRVAIGLVAGLPAFEPAVGVLRVQGVALLASFLLATWGYALISLHRHRALLVANAIGVVTSVGMVLALAPRHGAQGASWATVAGDATLATCYLVALSRHDRSLLPDPTVLLKGLAAGGAGLGAALLLDLGVVPRTLLALVVYGVLVVALRAIPPEFRAWLPARLR